MTTRKKGSNGFWLGALAGGVLGSIAALLLAPKAGKELRQDISTGAQKLGDNTAKAAGRAYDATGRFAKGIGSGAVQLVDRTKEAAGQIADAVKGIGRNERTDEDEDAVAVIASLSSEVGEEPTAEALEAVEIDESDSAKQI